MDPGSESATYSLWALSPFHSQKGHTGMEGWRERERERERKRGIFHRDGAGLHAQQYKQPPMAQKPALLT